MPETRKDQHETVVPFRTEDGIDCNLIRVRSATGDAPKGPVLLVHGAGVRAEIDRLDREIVALLVRRAACIDRAVAVKRAEGLPARIAPRVEEVIDNVRSAAAEGGLDPSLAEDLWRRLVDWSIAREERALAEARP